MTAVFTSCILYESSWRTQKPILSSYWCVFGGVVSTSNAGLTLGQSQKSRGYNANQRAADWKGDEVARLRGELRQRILNLSEQWKAERVSKEEARKNEAPMSEDQPQAVEPTVVDDSDSDVIIEETVAPPVSRKRTLRAS